MQTNRKKTVFCHILSCENNKGTVKEKIFRLPKDEENRLKWVNEIKKTKQINIKTTVFNVCAKHFEHSDIVIRKSEKFLKENAFPTIFENDLRSEANNVKIIEAKETETTETDDLKATIAELEKEIFRLKIQNDVALQHERIKTKEAVQVQKMELIQVRAELSKKDSEITKMSQVVEILRNNRLISDENAKFLNVNSTIFQFFDHAKNVI